MIRPESEYAVTVIIPCGRGHAKYAHRAIDSCLAARPRPDAIIVIDDYANPPVENYSNKIVSIIRLPEHRGRSYARNHAVSLAKTKWLFFLDSDDVMEPTAIEDFRVNCVDRYADIFYANYWYTSGGDIKRIYEQPPVDGNRRQRCMRKYNPANIGMFVKKSRYHRISGFDEDMAFAEYTDFFFRYIANPKIVIAKNNRPLFTATASSSASDNAEKLIAIGLKKVYAMVAGGYYKEWMKV